MALLHDHPTTKLVLHILAVTLSLSCLLLVAAEPQLHYDRSACPVSCNNAKSTWSTYYGTQELSECEGTIVFDLDLSQLTDESTSSLPIRACTAESESTKIRRSSPSSKNNICGDQNEVSLDLQLFQWDSEYTGHIDPKQVQSAFDVLLGQLEADDSDDKSTTLLFVKMGKVVIGGYSGSQIGRGTLITVIEGFSKLDLIQTSKETVAQFCREQATQAIVLGLIIDLTGDCASLLDSVLRWNSAQCIRSATAGVKSWTVEVDLRNAGCEPSQSDDGFSKVSTNDNSASRSATTEPQVPTYPPATSQTESHDSDIPSASSSPVSKTIGDQSSPSVALPTTTPITSRMTKSGDGVSSILSISSGSSHGEISSSDFPVLHNPSSSTEIGSRDSSNLLASSSMSETGAGGSVETYSTSSTFSASRSTETGSQESSDLTRNTINPLGTESTEIDRHTPSVPTTVSPGPDETRTQGSNASSASSSNLATETDAHLSGGVTSITPTTISLSIETESQDSGTPNTFSETGAQDSNSSDTIGSLPTSPSLTQTEGLGSETPTIASSLASIELGTDGLEIQSPSSLASVETGIQDSSSLTPSSSWSAPTTAKDSEMPASPSTVGFTKTETQSSNIAASSSSNESTFIDSGSVVGSSEVSTTTQIQVPTTPVSSSSEPNQSASPDLSSSSSTSLPTLSTQTETGAKGPSSEALSSSGSTRTASQASETAVTETSTTDTLISPLPSTTSSSAGLETTGARDSVTSTATSTIPAASVTESGSQDSSNSATSNSSPTTSTSDQVQLPSQVSSSLTATQFPPSSTKSNSGETGGGGSDKSDPTKVPSASGSSQPGDDGDQDGDGGSGVPIIIPIPTLGTDDPPHPPGGGSDSPSDGVASAGPSTTLVTSSVTCSSVSDCLVDCTVLEWPETSTTICADPTCTYTTTGCKASGSTSTTATTVSCPDVTYIETLRWDDPAPTLPTIDWGDDTITSAASSATTTTSPTTIKSDSSTTTATCPWAEPTLVDGKGDYEYCLCHDGTAWTKFPTDQRVAAVGGFCTGPDTTLQVGNTSVGINKKFPLDDESHLALSIWWAVEQDGCEPQREVPLGDYCTQSFEVIAGCDQKDTNYTLGGLYVDNGPYGCIWWSMASELGSIGNGTADSESES